MLAASLPLSVAVGAAHPHLFFQAGDVSALRSAAAGTHRPIASHLTETLRGHLVDPAPMPGDYDDPRFFGQDVCALAFGYQLTGDTRYADQATLRLQTYLTWPDWGFGEIASLGAPDLNTGHFLIGVSCAYDLLYDYLSDADRSAIAARLGSEAEGMHQSWSSAWYADQYLQNHNWINSAGMGLAGLALQGEDARAGSWLSSAQDNLAKVSLALRGISDGSWHEGLLYEEYGISMTLPFWMALRAIGSDYTDLGILRGLGKMFLVAQIPDSPRQQILLHGDFTGWPSGGMVAMLRFTAARFQDGLAETAARRWLAAGERSHLLPDMFFEMFELLAYDPAVAAVDPRSLPLDTYLPDLQASVLHSSWDAGDLALAFKAGPYGGRANFDRMKARGAPGGHLNWGHDHNDDMSFWLWGSGRWLAPEAAGYDAGTNTGYALSKRANMTAFHNGLLVDGTGELGDTRGSDDETANSWFFNRDAQPLLMPAGTADYAVAGGRGASLYGSSLGLSRWDRLVVLARKRYGLVRDDVAASSSHAYEWICHFLDGATVDTASGWIQGVARSDVSLGVRVVSPASWTATTGMQSANLTRLFELDNSISYVRVQPSVPSAAVQFLTALVPVPTAAWSSRVQIDPLAESDPGAGAVIAPGTKLEERWIFGGPDASGKAAGDLALAGSLVGMSARNAGAPMRALLVGSGSLLDQNGSRLLLATQSARVIEADVQGTTLAVSGDGITDFQAYAPGVTAANINGQSVAASRSGDVVQYPATPPTVAIGSSPAAITNQTTATFAFASNRDGTFSCTLDSGDAQPCTSATAYAALADGAHTFSVSATDTMRNVSAPASLAWTIDTVPPVASILSGPRSPTNTTSATFDLTSDDAGSTLSCKLDAGPPAPCTGRASFAALGEGAHAFTLTATDAAGNVSPPASFTWIVDTTPPTVAITATPSFLTKETSAAFTLASSEAASTFSCKLDAREPAPCTSPAMYGPLAAGRHVFTTAAIDAAGNASAAASFTWTIDTAPPGAAITAGPPQLTNQPTATFDFGSSKRGSAYFCQLDAAGFYGCSSPAIVSDLADGSHTFAVRAVDELGNADPAPATYRWTVDTVVPATTITSRPAPITMDSTATLTFSSTKPGATFECHLDAAEFTPCTTPLVLTGLAVGDHVLRVRSRDTIGNVDASPASYTWTVARRTEIARAGGCSSSGAPAASILGWIAAACLARVSRRRHSHTARPASPSRSCAAPSRCDAYQKCTTANDPV